MIGEKAGNALLEKIKNQNKPKKSLKESKNKDRDTQLISTQTTNSIPESDLLNLISDLPSYKKICILQGLLKEMKAMKARLEDNIENLLKKMSQNSFYYFKSKVEMKEIFDYCQLADHEIDLDFSLCENSVKRLDKDYQILYDVLFLLRENYNIMLLVIKNCKKCHFSS